MCGFAGVVRWDGSAVPAEQLDAMIARLTHRGPDAAGSWAALGSEPRVRLGHVRLSIIDLAGSPQPMATRDGRFSLVFNGEILNYRQLRAQLDYPFTSNGDTEVLLAGLAAEGASFVAKLRGQFAFALWDHQEQSLLLGRDRLGILPLFYSYGEGSIAFASEIKALLPALSKAPSVDHDSLDTYLAYGSVPAPFTLFRGLRKLPPAHVLSVDRRGRASLRRHWRPPARDPLGHWTEATAQAALEHQLREAVEAALVADVPVGAYLSGGLDSSLIVAIMRDLAPHGRILTFAAGFGDPRYDETQFARTVAARCATLHHQVDVRPSDFEDLWPVLTWQRDAPLAQPADIAVFRLAQLAREHVKVVLSGEGSDELFAGYPKYSLAPLTGLAGRWAPGLASSLEPRLDHVLGRRWQRVRIGLRSASVVDPDEAVRSWFAPFVDWERRRILTGAPSRRPLPAFGQDDPIVRRMLVHDLQTWLPDDLLERGDRMSMAASLEMRPPYLDRNLVDLAFRMPDSLKVRRGHRKWILKQVAASYLPALIINRPKIGFRVPLDAWFKDGLDTMARDLLLSSDSFVCDVMDRRTVAKTLDRHVRGRANEARALWTLLSLEVWHRQYFGTAAS